MKYFILILSLLMLCFCSEAQDVYSYGDTLRIVSNLSSGDYSDVDQVAYYIFTDVDQAIAGTYIANGTLTLKAGSGVVDSLFVAEWAIPSSQTENIYYLTIVMTYNGSALKNQTSTFKIGPLTAVMADTLGGMGYIDQTSTYGAGSAIGPIYLPGNIPADGAEILFYYTGTNTLAGVGEVDAAGEFKVWLDAAGTYDVSVSYPGFNSGRRKNITPTVP
jgi:hypothetical protein